MTICPNCGHPVETHEMFNPPRCPVVRLDWSLDGAMSSRTGLAGKPEASAPPRSTNQTRGTNDEDAHRTR